MTSVNRLSRRQVLQGAVNLALSSFALTYLRPLTLPPSFRLPDFDRKNISCLQ